MRYITLILLLTLSSAAHSDPNSPSGTFSYTTSKNPDTFTLTGWSGTFHRRIGFYVDSLLLVSNVPGNNSGNAGFGCGQQLQVTGCPLPASCADARAAGAVLDLYVGKTLTLRRGYKNEPIHGLRFYCKERPTGNVSDYLWEIQLTPGPPTPTPGCVVDPATIQLSGAPGSRLTGQGRTTISCTSPVNVRVSVPAGGVVDLSNGLTSIVSIGEGGGASTTLSINQTASVLITATSDAAWSAGTYQGSTPITVDIL